MKVKVRAQVVADVFEVLSAGVLNEQDQGHDGLVALVCDTSDKFQFDVKDPGHVLTLDLDPLDVGFVWHYCEIFARPGFNTGGMEQQEIDSLKRAYKFAHMIKNKGANQWFRVQDSMGD